MMLVAFKPAMLDWPRTLRLAVRLSPATDTLFSVDPPETMRLATVAVVKAAAPDTPSVSKLLGPVTERLPVLATAALSVFATTLAKVDWPLTPSAPVTATAVALTATRLLGTLIVTPVDLAVNTFAMLTWGPSRVNTVLIPYIAPVFSVKALSIDHCGLNINGQLASILTDNTDSTMSLAIPTIVQDFDVDFQNSCTEVDERGFVNASRLCSQRGKTWSGYQRNASSRACMLKLCATLGVSKDGLIVQNANANNAGRCTWVHPRLAEHLVHWLSLGKKTEHATCGLVYATTSPLFDGVKIGQWSGVLSKLLSRYRTSYGRDTMIVAAMVEDINSTEILLLTLFRPFSLGGELFDKACWGAVTQMLETM